MKINDFKAMEFKEKAQKEILKKTSGLNHEDEIYLHESKAAQGYFAKLYKLLKDEQEKKKYKKSA